MSLFQIIVLAFIFFVFLKILKKYREKIISNREMLLWSLVWLLAALLIIWPGTTSFLASQLGIGRGVDLIVYLALILNLYLIFRLYVRVEKLGKNITELVRKLAIKDALDSKQAVNDADKSLGKS